MNNNQNIVSFKNKTAENIPLGWSSLPINEVFEFIGTSSFSRNDLNYEVEEDSIYYIHYGDIHATYKNAVLDFDTETRIPVLNKDIKPSAHLLKEGDLVIADASEDYEGIGEALEVYNLGDKKALAGLHTFALRDNSNKTAHGYRAYIFKNHEVKNKLKTIATGSKVYGISKGNLTKFIITLPPYQEQQKIARILSIWDKAIVLQQQLIAQKQQNKKAIMKKLLTGELRFKGFETSQWRLKSLEEVALFKNGKGHETVVVENGDFIIVNSKFISTEGNVIKYTNHNLSPLNKDEITLVMSDIPNGKALAKCFLIKYDNKYSLNQRICSLKAKVGTDSRFLYYILNRNQHFLGFNNGVSQTNLRKDEVQECPLMMPIIDEQKKIAFFLSGIDKEINTLEKELIALQKQKQGLMQQLLTGKLRVKI
ncbi:restriction endonuclease subunit S [Flavobacterium hiemivividum]|uniref:Restriction endonuclease subunit S n=1 Tax=Flavobacterium hiemivividum TaxID=2541734 RepID=A0A4V2Z1K0_9FLAO|nr:restriction endonuclease subunit S [Flavobacterium hiemivividum]TDE05338.1 restriction endonuclease subunit S [Flavobacterium hiemivividum]